jgi:glycosyltransferase involved in cell wall biosynthesis
VPRISIITPVYNGAAHIEACLRNVESQNVKGLEHIVVDGGSPDGTAEIARQHAARNPGIRVYSAKDNGQSDAMNKGLRLAASPIVGILNVDDFYEAGAINDALQFLESHPNVDFVSGDCNLRDENDKILGVNRPCDLRLESLLMGWDFAPYPINPSAYFYRKEVHSVVGEYKISEHFAMDVCFLFACAAKVNMAYQPRIWGNFRHLPGAKTDQNFADAPRMMRRLRYRHIRMLPLHRRLPLIGRSLIQEVKVGYWDWRREHAKRNR